MGGASLNESWSLPTIHGERGPNWTPPQQRSRPEPSRRAPADSGHPEMTVGGLTASQSAARQQAQWAQQQAQLRAQAAQRQPTSPEFALISDATKVFGEFLAECDRQNLDKDQMDAALARFRQSEHAQQVDAALAMVNERERQQQQRAAGVRAAISFRATDPGELDRIRRYWDRTHEDLEKTTGTMGLVNKVREKVAQATDLGQLGILADEIPHLLRSRGGPAGDACVAQFEDALAQRVPEYGAARRDAEDVKPYASKIRYDVNVARNGFATGHVPQALVDPAKPSDAPVNPDRA